MNLVAGATLAMMEHRLGDILRRDADLLTRVDIGDAALVHGISHRALELGLIALDEALPVDRAFILPVQTPVDEMRHGVMCLL